MPTPEINLLDDKAVEEIAQKKAFQYGTMVSLTVAQRDALCATVRHFEKQSKAKSELLEIVAQHAESQLERLRAENERLTRGQHDLIGTLERLAASIGMSWCCTAETMKLEARVKRLGDFRSRAIQLCKDKAAEWEGDVTNAKSVDSESPEFYYAQAARMLSAELGKL